MKQKLIAAILLTTFVAGCATAPGNVAPSAISTMRYDDRSCKTLVRELDDVQMGLVAASATLQQKSTNDAVLVGVSLLLFWPAAFFVSGGAAAQEAEVARLKGEQIALTKKIRQMNCDEPLPPPPAPPAPAQPVAYQR